MRFALILLVTGCTLKDAVIPAETGDTYEPAPWDDADGDGYVVHEVYAEGDDCDDADEDIHPLALEICDGVDNDCDGTVDDGLSTIWYADSDGDGYGDPGRSEDGCSPPGGWVENADDCDDGDPGVSPDAEEVEQDGADNDCDGEYMAWATSHKAESVETAEIWGVDGGDGTYVDSPDWAGKRVLSPGDIDGDGLPDLVVSATASNVPDETPDSGGIYLFPGPILEDQTLDTASDSFHGVPGGLAGYGLAALGDLDGSGTIAVGMGNYGGRYWIVGNDGSGGLEDLNLLWETSGSSYFGLASAGGVDFDGDEAPDLIIGATLADSHRGQAFLYTGDLLAIEFSSYTLSITGDERESMTGNGVALVDLDLDGLAEAIVGAPAATEAATRSGAAYVVPGGSTGAYSVADAAVATIDMESCGLGYTAASAGDVDGDGAPDLIVGAPSCGSGGLVSAGAALLYLSAAGALDDGTLDAAAYFTGQLSYDYLSTGVADVGDLDGDGTHEVLLGAQGRNSDGVSGLAALWYGPIESYANPAEGAATTFYGTAYYEQLGYAVGGGQDLTGDGWPDLVFGGPTAEGLGVTRIVSGNAW